MKTKQNEERNRDGLTFRAAQVEVRAAEGDKPAAVRMSVSSETPVLMYIEFNGQLQRAYEILDHGPGSIDMSRCADGLVIRDRHDGDQIGLMQVAVAERKLGGGVEFCTGQRAQEISQDAVRGLRRNVSVGYRVKPGSYRLEGEKDGFPVVRALSWMPYEASFEPVPADASVGVGRADETQTTDAGRQSAATSKRSIHMSDEKKVTIDAEGVVEVYRLARAFCIEPGAADEHIKSGKTVEEFRAIALKKAEADKADMARKLEEAKSRKPDVPAQTSKTPEMDAGLKRQIEQRYSVLKVMRHLDATRHGGGASSIDIGFEREASQEIERLTGRKAQGIYIPHNAPVVVGRSDPFLKGSNGSNFVATNLLTGQFIDALRSKMVLADAGATFLTGLVGDVAIPKGGTITGGWVDGENGAATEGKPTVTQVTGTPKTASGYTDISRRLMIQSSIDVETFVQDELMNTVARLIEVAAFAGTNANGQPKGLASASGLNNPTITSANSITRAEALAFIENIMTDNAEFPNQSWIMRPNGWANLADRLPVAGIDNAGLQTGTIVGGGPIPEFILDVKTKSMLGFPYHVTTNVPNHSLWFGAWSQLVIGLWTGVDLLVDPYTNSTSGAVRVVALQDADIMVRHGQAFSYNAALTA